MNINPTVKSGYAFLSKWSVSLMVCGLVVGMWLYVLYPVIQHHGLTQSLHYLASPSGVWVSIVTSIQAIALSFFFLCGLLTNGVLTFFLGPLTHLEATSIGRKLASDNSLLQYLIISLGEDQINTVEVLLWAGIMGVYTGMRITFFAVEGRALAGQIRGVEPLLWVLILGIAGFAVVSVWLFWTAGLFVLLLMHYDGLQMMLSAVGQALTLRWNSVHATESEIKVTALAHAVAFLQWSHLLLSYMYGLGFPLQFFLFYKLGKAIQQLRQDAWRYKGFNQSSQLFMRQCPPLSAAETASLGDERCCMCWEGLQESPCSRLPCRHIHHV